MAGINAANAGTITIGGDLVVNRLGLGTNRIADNDASRAVLRRAVALGVNFIDTAEMYRQSETIIGATLAPYPPGVVVSTKGGVTPQFQVANDPANIRRVREGTVALKQIPWRNWPSGSRWAIAVVALEPEELASRYGLVFEEEWDELDFCQRAAIELPEVGQVWFLRYPAIDWPGTPIWVDE